MAGAVACDMIQIDRKRLLAALKRIQRIAGRSIINPILTGVRLQAHRGRLILNATDTEYALAVTLEVEGHLEPCVVSCADLISRIKTGKQPNCSLTLDVDQGALVINGSQIEHQLPTMDLTEFPAQVKPIAKSCWTVQSQELRQELNVALLATSREPGRYATHGVLLEVESHLARWVATDGRRLVTLESEQKQGAFEGKFILPNRGGALLTKLIGPKDDDIIQLSISKSRKKQPRSLQFASSGWRLTFDELDGEFPRYADVIPKSGTRASVDRKQFLNVLAEVSPAADLEHHAVQIDLDTDSVRISAGGAGAGRSSGHVSCKLLGGKHKSIVTAFNPQFLKDAFGSLDDERVILDLNPGTRDNDQIVGKPGLVYGESSQQIRWVIMPVSVSDQDVTIASAKPIGERSELNESTKQSSDQSPPDDTKPKRSRTEHVWPGIGERLDGEFMGETYAVLVVAAKGKSGRAMQVINGPAMGQIFKSLTAAMLGATEHQRKRIGQGESRKGLPVSGWSFWHKPKAKRASA